MHHPLTDRVSVIIPTRNEAARIGAFLASLPPEVELVVVDASDDTTPDLIHALRPERTQVIRSPARIAAARQIGAGYARGEWLLFSDADVRFAPDYFTRVATCLYGDAFYGAKYATVSHPVYSRFFLDGQRILDRIGFPAASGSNMAVRRAAFEAVGGFRLDLPVNEDTELLLRMAYQDYQIAFLPELAVYSLDDRRLERGSIRKMLHSLARCMLIALNLRVPVPQRLLRHDWGYWNATRRKDA